MKKFLYLILAFAALTAFVALTAACRKTDDPQQQTDSTDYLYFEAVEAGATVKMEIVGEVDAPSLEYSTDCLNWTAYDFSNPKTISLSDKGDRVYWRNTGKAESFSKDIENYIHFDLGDKKTASGGNIMSLLDKSCLSLTIPAENCFRRLFYHDTTLVSSPQLPATVIASDCYAAMFTGCSSLKKAPELPAMSLAPECYAWMFGECTSLVKAPELPATVIADRCYYAMFDSCSSITQAPILPATSVGVESYAWMFTNCTSLALAPELPATVLADACYYVMFSGCSSLTEAPELPATVLETECYAWMFWECTSLVKASGLPATVLAKACYSDMFDNCTSLTQAPVLPATKLEKACYEAMFHDCHSLKTAPELPATKLVDGCYLDMFKGCTGLSHIKVNFEDWGELAEDEEQFYWEGSAMPTEGWVDGVASEGIFECPANLELRYGTGYIPEGWSVNGVADAQAKTAKAQLRSAAGPIAAFVNSDSRPSHTALRARSLSRPVHRSL